MYSIPKKKQLSIICLQYSKRILNPLLKPVKSLPSIKDLPLTKPEVKTLLKPFLDLVLSLDEKNIPSVPLLLELAGLITNKETEPPGAKDRARGVLLRRIDRRYARLCRVQEELGRLDLKKAPPGLSPEDYIFSRIDFSRYREIKEKEFDLFFMEGLTDFRESFLKNNLGIGKNEIKTAITGSYERKDGIYKLMRDNPLILSIMRTLETSLENSPLFTANEIREETEKLPEYTGTERIPAMDLLYALLAHSLDNVLINHDDGMTTKLFISPEGDLSGTFRPGNKPWTLVLIPKA